MKIKGDGIKFSVAAVRHNDETNDAAVIMGSDGMLAVIELADGSSSKDLKINDIIAFDWEPYGPGVAMNNTTGKDVNVIVNATGLTPEQVRAHGFPQYPL
jgi:hypothetical protein